VARNTLILLRQAIERGGFPLTATGNLSRAVVAEMCKLIEWPDYDQADAFRFNKVINEPDFLPLHIVRQLAQAATFVRARRGKLMATPLGKSMLSDTKQGAIEALTTRDSGRARRTVAADATIDVMQPNIEERAGETIVRRQPVAGDLRQIIGVLRIANELEPFGSGTKRLIGCAQVSFENFSLTLNAQGA